MTEQPPPPQGATITAPPQSADGTSPQLPAAPGPPESRRMHTRISGLRTSLIAAAVGLVVVMTFVLQNAHAVKISFLGAHLHVSLAVALFLAGVAGALIMAAAGTARITQLRRIMRRDRRRPRTS